MSIPPLEQELTTLLIRKADDLLTVLRLWPGCLAVQTYLLGMSVNLHVSASAQATGLLTKAKDAR